MKDLTSDELDTVARSLIRDGQFELAEACQRRAEELAADELMISAALLCLVAIGASASQEGV